MVGEKREVACSFGDIGGPRPGRHQPSLEKVASFASLREPQLSLLNHCYFLIYWAPQTWETLRSARP